VNTCENPHERTSCSDSGCGFAAMGGWRCAESGFVVREERRGGERRGGERRGGETSRSEKACSDESRAVPFVVGQHRNRRRQSIKRSTAPAQQRTEAAASPPVLRRKPYLLISRICAPASNERGDVFIWCQLVRFLKPYSTLICLASRSVGG
jgi:hypothetical protein